jgi:NAD(P)-dependent dehydrogenase (short-subunit alcohol dehydrogenase family)
MKLAGKTILITGAAGGLGSALAMQCAGQGAGLVLLDKNRRGLSSLSDRMIGEGLPPPGLYPLDLAAAGIDDFNALVDVIESEFGGLDALVHCALDFEGLQPLDQIEPQQWLKSIQVNLNAPWLLSSTCLSLLKQSDNSRLFFLLDDPENVTGAYWGAYGTAKVALTGLVRQFEDSLSNTSIKVRGIIPGPMRTDFRAKIYHAENPLEQPEPGAAAEKIAAMLSADLSETEIIVRFTDVQA